MTSTHVGFGGLSFDGYESLHVLLGQSDGTFAYRNRYDFFYGWGNEIWFSSKREANEAFYLELLNNSSNSLLTATRGIGTILNDDN